MTEKSIGKDIQEKRDQQNNPEKPTKEEKPEKKSKEEIKIEKIENAKEEEQSLLDSWKNTKEWDDLIETPAYFEMQHYIQMVAQGISNCAIIGGSGGLGKSYTTVTTLNKAKADYVYTDSYSTAPAFYIWMYNNKEKILVLDDVIGIMEDKRSQAYLKSATWEVNGKRIVHNMSTKHLEDEKGQTVPDHFEFTGSIILLTNKINKKNAHVSAILTRADYVELKIDYKEKLQILEEISKKKWKDLTAEDRKKIFEFLKEHSSESVLDLNLRTLIHLYKFFSYSKKNNIPDLWKRLGLKLLQKEDLVLLVLELEKDETMKVGEKVEKFIELCGKSRPTYFRLKDKLNLKKEKKLEEKTEESEKKKS